MALQRLPITPVTVVDAAIVIIPDGIFTHTFPAKTISYPPITVHKPPQLAFSSSFTPQFQAFSASSSNGDSEESSVQLSEPEPESEPELEPEPESNSGDAGGIEVEVEKVSKNRRRIRSKVAIDASLQTVWGILTDYERLADIIPSLVVSQVLDKGENFARLLQIGQQNLAFGLKFSAKGVIDCYEQDFEVLPNGQRRDIDFKMIEGDFTIFEGKWSIEQYELSGCVSGQQYDTTLLYTVEVEPKMWLPVQLVEGRISREIQMNLFSIREEARKLSDNNSSG
ncbi:putative coenzyme Q-binding protein COQ10, START [Helianthus annuus]|nr:putative coenzyme Q-binding protein COQ10, START [Helianthus annuus]KAJ0878463.1 putative coenzyme Q-binding protein COQ10, START [Helianthus annuus]KAJ0882705.1 putative coenzyme Q-binding protein COQ10, START [Helianthus annuus]